MYISGALFLAISLVNAPCAQHIDLIDDQGEAAVTIVLSEGAAGVRWPHSDATFQLNGAEAGDGKIFAPFTRDLVLTFDLARCADGKSWSGDLPTTSTVLFYCKRVVEEQPNLARKFPKGAYVVMGVEANTMHKQTYASVFDDQGAFLGISFSNRQSRINNKRPKIWKVKGGAIPLSKLTDAIAGKCP